MIWRYLPYTLSLRAPAVLATLAGDRNGSRTLSFIPGSALRGAAARGFENPGKNPQRFRRLILDGSVRFLNAYPCVGNRRTLPMPISFRTEKSNFAGQSDHFQVLDLAAFDGGGDADQPDWPEAALSPLPDSFVSLGANQVRAQSSIDSRVHQQRDRKVGRAWIEVRNGREEPHGALFSFEYLQSEQEFGGIILLQGADDSECDALETAIKELLRGTILLGRSRRAGYGGDASIKWEQGCDREAVGQGLLSGDIKAGETFRALLTSPYIGQDPYTGQIDPSSLEVELHEAFSNRVDVVRRRWGFDVVGGFNRKWGLEVPQALACAAGSVLVLRALQPIGFSDLLAIEHFGFGKRQVEGFGRVLFLDQPQQRMGLETSSLAISVPPPTNAPEIVHIAEARIVEEEIDRCIQIEAARLASSVTSSIPTPSLLGRLRNAMRSRPETALKALEGLLQADGGHGLKRPAMNQLERCRIAYGTKQRTLAAWLREMATGQNKDTIAELLRRDALVQRFYLASPQTAKQHFEKLDARIRARLVDATVAALARKSRNQEPS